MQYVIIEELQKLMRRVKGENKFILLTHNNHFYLNVKYGFDRDESYGKNTFMRFNYNGQISNSSQYKLKMRILKLIMMRFGKS